MRVVITGAAGFIGSHLSEALLDRGASVVGIDNLLTGDLANIAHLRDRDFQFVRHDVTHYIDVEGPVDVVLHWASPASPIDYLELPIPTLKVGALARVEGEGALYVDPHSPEAVADAVRALDDDRRRAAVIAAGTEQLKRFSWHRSAGILLDAIAALAAR